MVAAGLAGPVGVVLQRIRRKVESDGALQAPDGPQVGLQGHNSALINQHYAAATVISNSAVSTAFTTEISRKEAIVAAC